MPAEPRAFPFAPDASDASTDPRRRVAPATARNREPILAVLSRYVKKDDRVLEIASGTGEHAVFLAPRLRVASWQPSDFDAEARASVDAYRDASPSEVKGVVRPAIMIDVMAPSWSDEHRREPPDVIVNINMIHITPWQACLGLLDGAAELLRPSKGILYLYGPYKRGGVHTAPSNEAFDQSLRARNPLWGVRDLEDVLAEAAKRGFDLTEVVEMPANNLSVLLRSDGGFTPKPRSRGG